MKTSRALYLEAEKIKTSLKIGLYRSNDVFWWYEKRLVSISEIEDRYRKIIDLLNQSNKEKDDRAAVFERLKTYGDALADSLFSDAVWKKIIESDAEILILKIDDRLVHIPWELIRVNGEFLCQRFSMGRVIKTRQKVIKKNGRPAVFPLKMWIVANPNGDLDVAGEEGETIFDNMEGLNELTGRDIVDAELDGDITPDEVEELIESYDLVHFAGHAAYDEQNPDQSGWELPEGNFTAACIDGLPKDIPMPSMIFSNACQSARTEEWNYKEGEDGSFGLSNAFLRAGVKHYIGTSWEITDTAGCRFATLYYQHLGNGLSVGEAMQKTRCSLIEEQPDVDWMSYVLYGDPGVSYFPDGNQDIVDSRRSAVSSATRSTGSLGKWFRGIRVNPAYFISVMAILSACVIFVFFTGTVEILAHNREVKDTRMLALFRMENDMRNTLIQQAEKTRKRVEEMWKKYETFCPELLPSASTLGVVLGSHMLPKIDKRMLVQVIQDAILYGQQRFNLVERDSFDKVLEENIRKLGTTPRGKRECGLDLPTHLLIVEQFDNAGNSRNIGSTNMFEKDAEKNRVPVLLRLIDAQNSRILISQFEAIDKQKPLLAQKETLTRDFLKKLESIEKK